MAQRVAAGLQIGKPRLRVGRGVLGGEAEGSTSEQVEPPIWIVRVERTSCEAAHEVRTQRPVLRLLGSLKSSPEVGGRTVKIVQVPIESAQQSRCLRCE